MCAKENDPSPRPTDEPTADGPLGDVVTPGEPSGTKVALVEGSRPTLGSETAALLHRRLRVAALTLLCPNIFFAVRGLLGADADTASPFVLNYRWFVMATQAVCTLVLFSRWKLAVRELRAVELAVFGISGVYFAALQYDWLQQAGAARPVDPFRIRYWCQVCVVMWFAFTTIYGTFIPNTAWRATAVMTAISLAPVAIITSAGLLWPTVGDVVFYDIVVTDAAIMAVAFTVSLYGSNKLGALRREVFHARQLGQYQLTEMLGAGGMGEVYLAEHRLLKRPCAVKLIRPAQAAQAKALARFEREVRAIARLTHWNSVEIFDYGRTDDGTFYYVMEFLPGLSLQEVVEQQGPMQPARVVHLLRQVCEALKEAHAEGITHRDIKPSNIVASMRGGVYDVAKLVDFGLATSIDGLQDVRLTQEGTVAGSPYYMAPEQFLEDGEPDARSDIYSLGAVTYFLLVGRPPFQGDKPFKVMMAHAHDEVVPPTKLNAALPSDLEQIVLRCLVKDPKGRFLDVAELQRALAACGCADQWSQELAIQWWSPRRAVAVGTSSTQTATATVS